uniref:Uncharacterized protein n=1 Tax=Picea sitchensis TaxID=3332 RepID=A0A6B9XXU2_PICSI|nr:hypothetical protein Q903MT_gene6832 [Picea sitchensis]
MLYQSFWLAWQLEGCSSSFLMRELSMDGSKEGQPTYLTRAGWGRREHTGLMGVSL